jgi:protoheme IX farnesyltransferase
LLIKDDYKNAGVPMLPVTSGEHITKVKVFIYTLVMSVVILTPYFAGFSGKLYLGVAAVLNLVFIYMATKTLVTEGRTWPKRTFLFSILYLFVIFLTLVADKFLAV